MKPSTRMFVLFLIFAALLLGAGSCVSHDDNDDDDDDTNDYGNVDDDVEELEAESTHPLLDLSPGKIAVPYPSFYLTAVDPQSPTGFRLTLDKALPDSLQLVLDVSDDIDLVQAVSELDGFSILGPVLIPFSNALALAPWDEALPGDPQAPGEGFARLFDVTVKPPVSLGYWQSFVEGQNVLILRPREPLLPGHRVLVCLSGPFEDAEGRAVSRPELFDAVMNGGDLPEDPLVEDLKYARDLIQSGALGVDSEAVLLAFTYITGTGQSVLHNIRKAVDDLDDQIPVVPEDIAYIDDRTIAGSFLSPEFRANGIIPAATSEDPTPVRAMTSLNFIVRLPDPIDAPLFPVIHLHGIGGSRDSAPTLENMAVFAIDAVLHGDRDDYTGEAPYPFLDFRNLRLFRDNVRQTIADHFALARLIRHLAEDPASFGLPEDLLAAKTLAVEGHSLGCLNAGGFASVDPLVDHLACVGGGGMFSVFQKRSAYGLFMPAAIRGLPPFEAQIFRLLMQAAIDTADPASLAPTLAITPPDGRAPRNVLIIEIIGDRAVPNLSTEGIAWAAGLGVNAGAAGNWFGLPEWPLPVTENLQAEGAAATGLLYAFDVFLSPTKKHGHLFVMPEQLALVHTFLQTAAETGIATIVDPEADR